MWPFYILVLVPILVQAHWKEGIDLRKKNKTSIIIFFSLLLILLMFRHSSIGNDTSNYINYFKLINLHNLSQIDSFSDEFGFVILTKIISFFTNSPQVYLAVMAIITIAMIFPLYLRQCEDPGLTISIFCILSTFVMLFSGIRQCLTIGLGFIAYEFAKRKKLIPFLLIVLVAISIHNSSIMLFVMYPLYHAKITRKWLYIVVPTVISIYIFNRQIFLLLAAVLNQFSRFDGSIEFTGAYIMIFLFVIFAVFAFLVPDEDKLDEETIGMRNFLLFSLVIQLFAPLNTLVMRMSYYYMIFIPLLMPKIIKCHSERYDKIAITARHIMMVFFVIYFLYTSATKGALHVFPYRFFWET